MPGAKLVILGNACRDVLYRVERFPQPGETVIACDVKLDLGGKGFNQAIAARRAGADVQLIAAIGSDSTAARLREVLQAEGMSDQSLIAREGVSDASLLLVDAAGENMIISNTSQARSLSPADVESALTSALDATSLLLLQGNLTEDATFHAMFLARRAGARIAVNPSPFQSWFRTMPPADVILVNQGEADALGELRAAVAIVTLGAQGCRLTVNGSEATHVAAPNIIAVSAGGAGDVFAGTFMAEYLQKGDPRQAARLAVRAASDKATRAGTVSAFPVPSAVALWRRQISESAVS